jgi:hypothetical protein
MTICALLASKPAAADISDAVYSDAKDVIEELLTTEVAHQVAPGIACLSGQRTDKTNDESAITYEYEKITDQGAQKISKNVKLEATTHFPKTLQQIYNRRYGSLKTTIRDESAGLAGYLVYEALHAIVITAPNAAAPSAAKKIDATVQTMIAKAAGDCPTDGAATSCGAPPPSSGAASPALTFESVTPEQFSACKATVSVKFESGYFGQVTSYPLEDACRAVKEDSFECNVGYAVRHALLGLPAAAQESMIKASAVLVKQVAAKLYQSAPDAGQLDAIVRQVLFLLRQQLTGDRWDPARFEEAVVAVARAVEAFDLTKLSTELRGTLMERFRYGTLGALTTAELGTLATELQAGWSSFDQERAAASLKRLSQVVELLRKLEQVHAVWRSVIDVDDGKIDVGAFVRAVLAPKGALAAVCGDDLEADACRIVARLGKGATESDQISKLLKQVQSYIAFASRGQYVEAAQATVRYVFQLDGGESDASSGVYQRFAESVVAYVLDASDGEAPSQATRVAFRTAAVEMIVYLGEGGGIRRRNWTLDRPLGVRLPKGLPFILPVLSLRASWSPSYVNVDDASARYLASANTLNLRFPVKRSEASYVGVELSLVDLLAPLNELALRKTEQTRYDHHDRLFLNFITPRIDVIAGSPMLSEHLVVAAGISLRMTAPVGNGEATLRNGEPSYDYTFFWDAKDSDRKPLWPRFLEFGFALKYVI